MIEKIKDNLITIIGILLIIISISVVMYDNYKDNQKVLENVELVENFFEIENNPVEEQKEEVVIKDEEDKKTSSSPTYNYIAVLEIPSIKLKRGLVDYKSKYNNIKYNIQIIEHSQMPDIENSNLILAGHNGTSSVSFFNDLDKLKEDSLVYVYYNNFKYIYKINNNYEVNKDGKVEIIRNRNKTTITLITCKKDSKDKQLVYIGYLVDKVEY